MLLQMVDDRSSSVVARRARRVLCAPDSFKDTLPASEAAAAMAEGVDRLKPPVQSCQCPVADGGEGSLETLMAALGGSIRPLRVTGPLGEPVESCFGITGDGRSAVVELARASGLGLVRPPLRDPTRTTSYGTGQLIAAAARSGCETIIVCIGGSATVDGGAAIAQALGAEFRDSAGRLISEPLTGGRLCEIRSWQPPGRLPLIRVACDVINPLLGSDGAAAVYAPQKGATPAQVNRLGGALEHLAALCGVDPDLPGAGAAGGAGYGLAAFCGARLERGIDLVLEAVGFRRRLEGMDLVLTGEGCLDGQSLAGKAPLGVARAAAELGVRTVAIVGRTAAGAETCLDPSRGGLLAAVISLARLYGQGRAIRDTATLLADAAEEVVREWKTGE